MTKNILIVLIIAVTMSLSACQRLDESELRLPPSDPVYIQGTSRADAMQAAEAALNGMNFVIEKYDESKGLIRTRYLSASQFIEFWRSDNVGLERSAEANLHSIQRQAMLHFTEAGNRLRLKCQINTRRLSLPAQDIRSMSSSAGMFTGGSRSGQELKLQEDNLTWMDLGPDPGLEEKILAETQKNIERQQRVK